MLELWGQILWRRRGTAAGAALAILSLWWMVDAPSTWIGGAATLAGAALAVWDVRRARLDADRWRFVTRDNEDLLDVAARMGADATLVRSPGEIGVALEQASTALRHGRVRCVLPPDAFRLRPEMAEWSLLYVAQQARRSRMWNDPALGLASDLTTGQEPVTLRRCNYFDFVGTNLLSRHDVHDVNRLDSRPVKDGREWILDRDELPRRFADSWLANIIGVSTLSFTVDGKLVVVRQSNRNTGSPGHFAPSGSGALEPRDLDPSGGLGPTVVTGANRELEEECGIPLHHIEHAWPLGHGRWLSRGAMPEFSCVSLLDLTSDAVDELPIPRNERVFTDQRLCVRLDVSEASETPLSMLPSEVARSASFPLALAMHFLRDEIRSGEGEGAAELRTRLLG